MLDREQQLIDAAMRYQVLLNGPQPVSIRDFVATAALELREELAAYLEFMLFTPELQEPIMLSAEDQVLAERVEERTRSRLQQRMATTPSVQSLSALRQARRLSLGALARQLNLPIDLLHRIERGGVRPASIPNTLVVRLAAALEQAEADIRAALTVLPPAAATRLSALDGTTVEAEAEVDFVDALTASSATNAQKAEWG